MTRVTRRTAFALVFAGILLSARGKTEEAPEARFQTQTQIQTQTQARTTVSQTVASAAPLVEEKPLRAAPDFGGNAVVSREADGIGETPEAAVLAALQSAVAQVNGGPVASHFRKLALEKGGRNAGNIQPGGISELVAAASEGMVLGYEILSREEVEKVDKDSVIWTREVDASEEMAAEIDENSVTRTRGSNASGGTGGAGVAVTLNADARGHFQTACILNGVAVQCLVDTGASVVAISAKTAARLNLDITGARESFAQTATGTVKTLSLKLSSVQVGNITLNDVDATVMPGEGDTLLGMSFLNRVSMEKDEKGGTMTLRRGAGKKLHDGARRASGETGTKRAGKAVFQRGGMARESEFLGHEKIRYWKVRVRAQIAQYRAPEEKGRPKITVAMPRAKSGTYPVGDQRVRAEDVARAIQQELVDILTQTQRFIVLDRDFDAETDAEFARIAEGGIRAADSARLGQRFATDLILIPVIERFEYPRHERALRMSDRKLVSYSGGGRVSLRLLNAATGEIVLSDGFEHTLPVTAPSTLPREIDGKNMAKMMMKALTSKIGQAIVGGIFPISVVQLSGDQVVLSQGGDAVQTGERWLAVTLGEALTDPQTGRSLGRNEIPCCTIRIDRVAAQTAYGTIEEGAAKPGSTSFRPGSIELRAKRAPGELVAAAQKTPDQKTEKKTLSSGGIDKSKLQKAQSVSERAQKVIDEKMADKASRNSSSKAIQKEEEDW
ncbi:MAG: TIGR02281 family clan AA aspartic protease [Candidatus Accumulibacter sp.]|nr:TIGR02281 family clan AA aspartic protease [Accumulibacter sp.]